MIPDDRLLRRLLVALDASPPALAALEGAIILASRLKASLKGLYVQDASLMKLAAHPCATTFSLVCPPGSPAGSSDDILLRAMRLREAQVRRAMSEASLRASVHAEFSIRQGKVEAEILAEAGGTDLLILGWTGKPGTFPVGPVKPGSLARSALQGAPSSVLLLQHQPFGEGPVMLAYDGSQAAEKALTAALELAWRDGGRLAVLLLADNADAAADMERRINARLASKHLKGLYQMIPSATPEKLKRAVSLVPGGILVLAAGTPLIEEFGTGALLDGVSCSIALIR
jgi:nucleotide-binding universal stress UspA family protein